MSTNVVFTEGEYNKVLLDMQRLLLGIDQQDEILSIREACKKTFNALLKKYTESKEYELQLSR